MKNQKEEIQAALAPFFKQAIEERKWFFCPYQALWFSPQELAVQHDNGHFLWGPVNWELRPPQELITSIEEEIKELTTKLNDVKKRAGFNQ